MNYSPSSGSMEPQAHHYLAAAVVGLTIGMSFGSLTGGLLDMLALNWDGLQNWAIELNFSPSRMLVALGALIGLAFGSMAGAGTAWFTDHPIHFPLGSIRHFHASTNG